VVLRGEVGRGEADQVAVETVEERDDPGDRHQPGEKPAQLLLLDDLGDVYGVPLPQIPRSCPASSGS
jgi:hypothetical protein